MDLIEEVTEYVAAYTSTVGLTDLISCYGGLKSDAVITITAGDSGEGYKLPKSILCGLSDYVSTDSWLPLAQSSCRKLKSRRQSSSFTGFIKETCLI